MAMTEMKDMKPVEIKIRVPWGHIAGKVWGKTGPRILAVHGIQDNCGVFDQLISLLKGKYQVVAIDLPGHGLSSHFPPNILIDYINYIIAVVYVVKEIRWDRFHFVGHSLGGLFGLFFSALYPEYVQTVICLDHISPIYAHDSGLTGYIRNTLDEFMTLQDRLQKGNPPVYTYEEALEKLTKRESALTTEAANIVLKRSLREKENNYTFCMDQRLKLYPFLTLTIAIVKDVIKNVNCSTLFLLSTERTEVYHQIFKEIFECIEKKTYMTVKVVEGNHDVHQNHPERVVNIIEEFLIREQCKL